MHWECRSFGHSRPTLSLCQALQVLTWFQLQMDTCPLGAHSQPCCSPCKDACWLPYRLTNPHARWVCSQTSSRAPHAKVRRDFNLSSLQFKAGHFPGQVSWAQVFPNALFELLCSSFHLCSKKVERQQWVPSPSLILLPGLAGTWKSTFPMSPSLRKDKKETKPVEHQPLDKDKLPAETKRVSGEKSINPWHI